MDESEWADRFSREVDNLIGTPDPGAAGAVPPEYRQTVDLARALAAHDFSRESQVRQALRRQLLNQVDARGEWEQQKEYPMRTFLQHRKLTLILGVVMLAALAAVTLAWPGVIIAAAQEIAEFVQHLELGEYTSMRQADVHLETPGGEASSPGWIIKTAIGNFGGNVPPGEDATVQNVSTFDEAQALVPFSLRRPGYLPTGYVLHEAMVAPTHGVFLIYGGPEGDIVLAQTPVGEELGSDPSRIDVQAAGVITEGAIEVVAVNGQQAGWVEGNGLTWEADGVSYSLGGASLSLEETIRIAESLE